MRRLLRLLKWTFALLLGLPLLAYLGLLLINLNDQPPSAEALEMQRILAERPVPADEDNAYVYMLGFLAVEGMAPTVAGQERMQWMTQRNARSWSDPEAWADEPPRETLPAPRTQRLPAVTRLIEECAPIPNDCVPAFAENPDALRAWIDSEEILIERYLQLLGHSATFIPANLIDIRTPLVGYQHVLDGQRALLARAWMLAQQGELLEARDLLERDLAFWRMVQVSSNTLIDRSIATAAIRQHFRWGRSVLDVATSAQGISAIPASWRTPFDESERSLLRMLNAEWQFSNGVMHMMREGAASHHEQSFTTSLLERLYTPLLQPQAYSNVYARELLHVARSLAVPLSEARKAHQQLQQHLGAGENRLLPLDSLYDPVGQWFSPRQVLLHIVSSSSPRIHDLESIRRASLLLVSAVAEKIPDEGMADYVAGQNELIDPYSEEPFGWDAEKGVLLVPLLQQDEPLAMPLR